MRPRWRPQQAAGSAPLTSMTSTPPSRSNESGSACKSLSLSDTVRILLRSGPVCSSQRASLHTQERPTLRPLREPVTARTRVGRPLPAKHTSHTSDWCTGGPPRRRGPSRRPPSVSGLHHAETSWQCRAGAATAPAYAAPSAALPHATIPPGAATLVGWWAIRSGVRAGALQPGHFVSFAATRTAAASADTSGCRWLVAGTSTGRSPLHLGDVPDVESCPVLRTWAKPELWNASGCKGPSPCHTLAAEMRRQMSKDGIPGHPLRVTGSA